MNERKEKKNCTHTLFQSIITSVDFPKCLEIRIVFFLITLQFTHCIDARKVNQLKMIRRTTFENRFESRDIT